MHSHLKRKICFDIINYFINFLQMIRDFKILFRIPLSTVFENINFYLVHYYIFSSLFFYCKIQYDYTFRI